MAFWNEQSIKQRNPTRGKKTIVDVSPERASMLKAVEKADNEASSIVMFPPAGAGAALSKQDNPAINPQEQLQSYQKSGINSLNASIGFDALVEDTDKDDDVDDELSSNLNELSPSDDSSELSLLSDDDHTLASSIEEDDVHGFRHKMEHKVSNKNSFQTNVSSRSMPSLRSISEHNDSFVAGSEVGSFTAGEHDDSASFLAEHYDSDSLSSSVVLLNKTQSFSSKPPQTLVGSGSVTPLVAKMHITFCGRTTPPVGGKQKDSLSPPIAGRLVSNAQNKMQLRWSTPSCGDGSPCNNQHHLMLPPLRPPPTSQTDHTNKLLTRQQPLFEEGHPCSSDASTITSATSNSGAPPKPPTRGLPRTDGFRKIGNTGVASYVPPVVTRRVDTRPRMVLRLPSLTSVASQTSVVSSLEATSMDSLPSFP